jgi:hypothetical protein
MTPHFRGRLLRQKKSVFMEFQVFQNLAAARFKASHQSRIRTADRTRPGLVPGLCFSGGSIAIRPMPGTQKHLRENRLNQPLRDVNPSVALYWDFENLHASLSEARLGEGSYGKPDGRFKTQEPLIDVQAIVDLAASFGPIAINRAYCNWQFFGRYRDLLLQNAMELIQLFPPGASTKNGADIRLCLDAADDIARHTPHRHGGDRLGRQRLHAPGAEDPGRRAHAGGHRHARIHQPALGAQLQYVPLLRRPDGSGRCRRTARSGLRALIANKKKGLAQRGPRLFGQQSPGDSRPISWPPRAGAP